MAVAIAALRFLLLAALAMPAAAGTNEFGKSFLAKMKAETGVVALPSGLMYRVISEGDGEEHPLRDTSCECHYEGRTAQEYSKEPKGKKFDSSYDRGSYRIPRLERSTATSATANLATKPLCAQADKLCALRRHRGVDGGNAADGAG